VSVGTIWTVGGLAPVTAGIPNGRGRLLSSGTNATLYTTPFSAANTKSKEHTEKERYESRLADALHLDRISRVFEFRDPLKSPSKMTPEFGQKTTWNGTEWVMAGLNPSKLILLPLFVALYGLMTSRGSDC
jgi:meiosis-specific APC/C activator protein AMA1